MKAHDGIRLGGAARRTAALALAALSLGAAGVLAAPGRAEAVQCPPGTVQLGILCVRDNSATTVPAPATTTTTAPPAPQPAAPVPPAVIPPPPPPPPAPAVSSADTARRLLELVNAERAKSGLGALAWRDDVAAIALAHSQRMAQAGDIFHSDSFFGAAVKKLLNAVARGENVAYNGSVESAHSRLMASSGHRANILDARFSVAGFGVVRHADGRYFITQNFIQPDGAPASAAPRPVAPPAAKPAAAKPAAAKPAPTPAPAPAPAPATTEAPVPTTTEPAPAVADDSATLSLAEDAPEALTATPAASSAKLTLAAAGVLVTLAATALACWAIPRRFRS